jgi:hypothetical protein
MSNPRYGRTLNPMIPTRVPGRTIVRPIISGGGSTGRIIEAKSWCYVDAANPNTNFPALSLKSTVSGNYTDAVSGRKAIINFERVLLPGSKNAFEDTMFVLGYLAGNLQPSLDITVTYPASSGLKLTEYGSYLRVTPIILPFVTNTLTWNNYAAAILLGTPFTDRALSAGFGQLNNFDTVNPQSFRMVGYAQGNGHAGTPAQPFTVFDYGAPIGNTCYGLLLEIKPVATLDAGLTLGTIVATATPSVGDNAHEPIPAPYVVLKR